MAVVAVSAVPAPRLRIAYGVEVICCRGESRVKELPPLTLAPISRKRSAPEKAFAPKFSVTVKIPPLTETFEIVCVGPI